VRNFFSILILSIILIGQASFALAATQATDCDQYCSDPASYTQPPGKTCLCPPTRYRTITELIDGIINAVFKIGIILAPLMILWGAFTFVTAAGRPEKIETGKKIIFWAIVGLAIILFSRAIISIVRSILGG
jgi:hypothetical protein